MMCLIFIWFVRLFLASGVVSPCGGFYSVTEMLVWTSLLQYGLEGDLLLRGTIASSGDIVQNPAGRDHRKDGCCGGTAQDRIGQGGTGLHRA
jgi:hypothetical protein